MLQGGQLEKVLIPGAYWITPKQTLLLCDVRPTPFQVSAQVSALELLTSDGMGVRMSLGGEYRITNPTPFLVESSDAFGASYLEMRQALHSAVGELNSNSFLSGQALVTARVKELLVPRPAQPGIEMTQLEVREAVPVGWLRQI